MFSMVELMLKEWEIVKQKQHVFLRDEDVPTRWNSTYYMGKGLLEQRAAVDLYLNRHNKRRLRLSAEEWNYAFPGLLLIGNDSHTVNGVVWEVFASESVELML
uniref:Uncharacterized protein n=1 Tax=Ditylenchus dipsaci TaxID=166011 RepID=A0A915E3G0_9BILA